MSTTLSKIFLSTERGFNETPWMQSYNTFNFGDYQQEHKKPIGDVVVFNDDILAPGRSLSMITERAYTIFLLPVLGAVEYVDSTGAAHLAAAGQTVCIHAAAGLQYTIKNPFAEVPVNFIQIWINDNHNQHNSGVYTYSDVNSRLNELLPAANNDNIAGIYIGKFSGRGDTTFTTSQPGNTLFAFVLAGAFEVEGCLLHDRDGLAMLQKTSAEMEALSNDALILLVEQVLQTDSFT